VRARKPVSWSADDLAVIKWCVEGDRHLVDAYGSRGRARLKRICLQLDALLTSTRARGLNRRFTVTLQGRAEVARG